MSEWCHSMENSSHSFREINITKLLKMQVKVTVYNIRNDAITAKVNEYKHKYTTSDKLTSTRKKRVAILPNQTLHLTCRSVYLSKPLLQLPICSITCRSVYLNNPLLQLPICSITCVKVGRTGDHTQIGNTAFPSCERAK